MIPNLQPKMYKGQAYGAIVPARWRRPYLITPYTTSPKMFVVLKRHPKEPDMAIVLDYATTIERAMQCLAVWLKQQEPPMFIRRDGVEYVRKSVCDAERKLLQVENERLRNL